MNNDTFSNSTNSSEKKFSKHGLTMLKLSGVRAIMKDIMKTLQTGCNFINLSAGNPVVIPQVQDLWEKSTKELMADKKAFGEVLCRYGASRGYEPFIEAIIDDFSKRLNTQLTPENILITPGSQILYFYAMNSLCGYFKDNSLKKVVLPLSPDYTGYGGVTLTPESLVCYQPDLEIFKERNRFKYHPQLDNIILDDTVGMVLFSRPCNPTGNILTFNEVKTVVEKAKLKNIPVFIDSAYAPPYPALNFTQMELYFDTNVVHCVSMSKTGLPGERIGVAIGPKDIIHALECFQTNACIHSSRFGQAIATKAIKSGRLEEISKTVIRSFYQEKMSVVLDTLDKYMPKNISWYVHEGEGAIFSWLWLKDLPCSDWDFYNKLKKNGLILVPGSPFFPNLNNSWKHANECLRISLTATLSELEEGMKIIAKTTEAVYLGKENF